MEFRFQKIDFKGCIYGLQDLRFGCRGQGLRLQGAGLKRCVLEGYKLGLYKGCLQSISAFEADAQGLWVYSRGCTRVLQEGYGGDVPSTKLRAPHRLQAFLWKRFIGQCRLPGLASQLKAPPLLQP